jgi:hypothetical protein
MVNVRRLDFESELLNWFWDSLGDAKIFVLEVHVLVLQPFDLSLTEGERVRDLQHLSSDKERAQKVMARLEGWRCCLGCRRQPAPGIFASDMVCDASEQFHILRQLLNSGAGRRARHSGRR